MAQNIYDNPEFFAGYSRLGRSVEGLDGAAEWPSLRVLLPEMRGLRVLDLGCGFGWFCRWARTQGAAEVLGIDISEKMLAHARAETGDLAITYARGDLDRPELPMAAFGLVYSSLALHYVADLRGLLAQVHRALVPGGSFVFSAEHPIYTAPSRPQWSVVEAGNKTWPIDNYLVEGPRTTDWLAKGVVKHHRTIGTYVALLLGAGFTLTHLEEWSPSDEQITAHPSLAEERHRPMFVLMAAQHP